ncbi:MAG: hypothetical protein E3J72_11370 [Planctomycetota bacterium]|nr:MAG: hypothetical protein E3J72_11370 [Planctomycetota bacterium]
MKQSNVILIFVVLTLITVMVYGCGGGHKSDRIGGAGTGTGTGTGSGTGSGNGGGTGTTGGENEFVYVWVITGGSASTAELEAMRVTIQAASEGLYEIAHGQQYIKHVTIKNNGTIDECHISTPLSRVTSGTLGGGLWARTGPGGLTGRHIECGGTVDPFTFAHEHGHMEYNLAGGNPQDRKEEYTNGGCPCVMSTGASGGRMQYCDDGNHTYSFDSCWKVILNQTSMTHTTGDYPVSGAGPLTEIVIEP